MGERKGQNKYYPPDFDPKKTGNLNKYHGTHALRERARKIDQGIIIIRFEAPWNFWCTHCNSHIGRGVRWNAEKKKVGMYYTTPLYSFKLRCHLCGKDIVFETDPKNRDYKITEGGKKRTETWDPKDTETIELPDAAELERRANDPMYREEHIASDKQRAEQQKPILARLMNLKEETSKYNYEVNSLMRSQYRVERKKRKAQQQVDANLKDKYAIDIPLLPETEEVRALARAKTYGAKPSLSEQETFTLNKQRVKRESIFGTQAATPSHVTAPSPSITPIKFGKSAKLSAKNRERQKEKVRNTLLASLRKNPVQHVFNQHSNDHHHHHLDAAALGIVSHRVQERHQQIPTPESGMLQPPVDSSTNNPVKKQINSLVDYASDSGSDSDSS